MRHPSGAPEIIRLTQGGASPGGAAYPGLLCCLPRAFCRFAAVDTVDGVDGVTQAHSRPSPSHQWVTDYMNKTEKTTLRRDNPNG